MFAGVRAWLRLGGARDPLLLWFSFIYFAANFDIASLCSRGATANRRETEAGVNPGQSFSIR